MSYPAYEVNFDGLVGPTHNFSGLSFGNEASMENKGQVSNPKLAALQGLEKMKLVASLGVKQAVLPPHERPNFPLYRGLGFTGTEEVILQQVKEKMPWLIPPGLTAAPMWAANSATVCPSLDSIDQHVHFTPANMATKIHRSYEHKFTSKLLRAIFPNSVLFTHHDALEPGENIFTDEGAANHTRFCKTHKGPGVHLFVYGKAYKVNQPTNFPARQSLQASQAVSNLHQIFPKQVIFAQQNVTAINEGVFHNDVISTGNENVFLYHPLAFAEADSVLAEIQAKVAKHCDTEMILVPLDLPLHVAVKTYIFNSQIITLPDSSMAMIAPLECQQTPETSQLIQNLINDSSNPINTLHYVDVRESMRNGGGPACLRLRVVLNENQLSETKSSIFFTEALYAKLKAWIEKHYRDRLHPNELHDPKLARESETALDELTKILNLGSIYPFQTYEDT